MELAPLSWIRMHAPFPPLLLKLTGEWTDALCVCPHCLRPVVTSFSGCEFRVEKQRHALGVAQCQFEDCRRIVVKIRAIKEGQGTDEDWEWHPIGNVLAQMPRGDLPAGIRADLEAALQNPGHPQVGAAMLGRLCEGIIRMQEHKGKSSGLRDLVDKLVMDGFPSPLRRALLAFVKLRNLGAHYSFDAKTGEPIPPDAAEVEFLLSVSRLLLEIYFLLPAEIEKRLAALNQKLAKIDGKPVEA